MTTTSNNGARPENIRVYLVDDHPIVLDSLRDMLNGTPGIQVTGQAESYEEAVALFRRGLPDVGIINLTLHRRSGLALIKELTGLHADVRLLALSMHDERLYATRALRAGAKGYFMKTVSPEEISNAIRQIHAGQLVVSPRVREQLLAEAVGRSAEVEQKVSLLSDSDLAVLEGLGKGMSAEQIAVALGLNPKWMKNCFERIKGKMGCASMRDLIQEACRLEREYEI